MRGLEKRLFVYPFYKGHILILLDATQVRIYSAASKRTPLMIEKLYSYLELKNCPIDMTFKIIGQKWSVLILREMFRNQIHFNHILQNTEGLTPRILSQKLKTLQILGIIEKRTVLESPTHVEYRLTMPVL